MIAIQIQIWMMIMIKTTKKANSNFKQLILLMTRKNTCLVYSMSMGIRLNIRDTEMRSTDP